MRRAYLLVATDRDGLTLDDWLDEVTALHGDTIGDTCRPLSDGTAPESALIGIPGFAGCLYAVFDYRISATPEGRRILSVRGPSLTDIRDGGPVSHAVDHTLERLTHDLSCVHSVLQDW